MYFTLSFFDDKVVISIVTQTEVAMNFFLDKIKDNKRVEPISISINDDFANPIHFYDKHHDNIYELDEIELEFQADVYFDASGYVEDLAWCTGFMNIYLNEELIGEIDISEAFEDRDLSSWFDNNNIFFFEEITKKISSIC